MHRIVAPALPDLARPCPILIVWGRADRLVLPVHAEAIARRMAGAQVALSAEAGRVPQPEQQTHVTDVIGRFLNAQPS